MPPKKYGPAEIGSMLKARTFCDDHGHKFDIVKDSVTQRTVSEGTEIWNSFICVQCGYIIQRMIALWPKKSSGSPSKEDKDL